MPGISAAVCVAAVVLALHRLDTQGGIISHAQTQALGYALPILAIVISGLTLSRLPYADLPKHYGAGGSPGGILPSCSLPAC